MPNYHINSQGEPGVCQAKVQCRFGGAKEHYTSAAEARRGFEKKMEKELLDAFAKPADHYDSMRETALREELARERRVEDLILKSQPDKTVRRVMMDRGRRDYDDLVHNRFYVHPDFKKLVKEDNDLGAYLIKVQELTLNNEQKEWMSTKYDPKTGIVDLTYPLKSNDDY